MEHKQEFPIKPKPIPLAQVIEVLKDNNLLEKDANSIPCAEFKNLEPDTLVCYPETDTREFAARAGRSVQQTAGLLPETSEPPAQAQGQAVVQKRGQARCPVRTNDAISSFICIKGFDTDGHNYIHQAVSAGVRLIISEYQIDESVFNIVVKNSRRALAVLAKTYFNNPSAKFKLIGVTGTNGKTSIVKIIETIFLRFQLPVASIGTLGYSINGEVYDLERTTPDITQLNSILSLFVEKGIQYVVMEVSSHALSLDRVYGLEFDFALFTNLSREHLDFHSNMDDYFNSKALLFDYLNRNKGTALINIDDEYGRKLYSTYTGSKIALMTTKSRKATENVGTEQCSVRTQFSGQEIIKYSIEAQSFRNTSITIKLIRTDRTVSCPYDYSLETQLIGEHNAFNVAAALVLTSYALSGQISPDLLSKAATYLPHSLRGRLERVNNSDVHCFIDYAHTPNALESVCRTLSELIMCSDDSADDLSKSNNPLTFHSKKRKLTVVFGAGGDRDKGKRKEMTESVLKYADLAIITTDNPRTENRLAIILDMVEHIHPFSPYLIVPDRKDAIATAIKLSSDGDVVLIAGKGHETYQIIGDKKVAFNDYEQAQQELQKRTVGTGHCPVPTGAKGKTGSFDMQASSSNPTVKLDIPLSIHQIKLLLRCCNQNDLGIDRDTKAGDRRPVKNIAALRDEVRTEHCSVPTETEETIKYVTTDTRQIKDSTLFIALTGDRFDGQDFVDDALSYKNNYAVINKDRSPELLKKYDRARLIVVDDTLPALALLAKKYKSLFSNTTIALTGSTGKTSVKEICYNIFSQAGKTLKNVANENNIIGVSRTILNLNQSYLYLILEVGTNRAGEMQILADTVQPDIGLIINIGHSHLEAFKDLHGIYREKSKLLKRNMPARIIPANDTLFDELKLPAVEVGTEHCSVRTTVYHTGHKEQPAKGVPPKKYFTLINDAGNKKRYSVSLKNVPDSGITTLSGHSGNGYNDQEYYIPTNIDYISDNASYAVAAAMFAGIQSKEIRKGLSIKLNLKNRMEIIRLKDMVIISDCYNANPASMKAAIDYWTDNYPDLIHIAVIGDMLELGSKSGCYHKEIGDYLHRMIKEYKSHIYTVGNHSRVIKSESHYYDVEELLRANKQTQLLHIKNSVLLLKGSRGIRLDKILELFPEINKTRR